MRRIISKDHSMAITKGDNVQERFNKLMGEFLKELPTRIDSIPCTIILDVEKGADWWNFVAHIESAQHSVQRTAVAWASVTLFVGFVIGWLVFGG